MAEFNPIKETTDGVQAKKVIWTTKTIEMAIKGLEQGRKLVANPFYENNTKLLKGDLVFERTKEEIKEWKKCASDIHYFTEKYCKLMTPQGIKNIKLRDYQKNYLQHLVDNRLSIFLACRQCGKCLIFNQLIKIHKDITQIIDNRLKKKYFDKFYYNDIEDCYELPLFELYNLFDNSFKWKIKYHIYKLLYKIESCERIKTTLYKLLEMLNDGDDNSEKLLNSHLLNGVKIKTDEGWSPASYIHFTKPFEIYKLYLENGMILECADEHIVFTKGYNEKWVKDLTSDDYVITVDGLSKVLEVVKSGIFVNMCDISVLNEKESYYTNGILSHNTTTSAIFLLHYILFNVDKNALVLGNKGVTAREILDKIKKIYLEIPYFLKPGIYKWNEREIVLDNNTRVISEVTTQNSGISFTFHCVLADEFAHIHPNILDSFYNNLFPTITAGKARFMITSTQNGYNLFYRLYTSAVKGENEYAPFKTDWWEVPEWNPDTKTWERRDEKWHQLQVANYGSEEAFNRQFGTNFDISSNTLISRQVLNKKQKQVVQFVNKELPGVTNSDSYFWDPLYEPMEMLKNDKFVITIDLATGIGADYTTYIFNKLEKNENGNVVTRCIGYYQDNGSSIDKNIVTLIELCDKYCNMNNYLISYESNLYGELFKRLLFKYIDENTPSNFDESVLVKYYNERMTDFNYGVKMTTATKNKCCKFFKMDYEADKIFNDSTAFMNELSLFCDNKGNDTYQASFGHDDIVMAQLQLILVQETLQYKELVSNIDMDLGENNSGYNFYEIEQPFTLNINRLYGYNW